MVILTAIPDRPDMLPAFTVAALLVLFFSITLFKRSRGVR